jgi:hypothetical protein
MGLDFYCECGQEMCGNVEADQMRRVVITPCPKCLKDSYEEGYKEGYDAGQSKSQ